MVLSEKSPIRNPGKISKEPKSLPVQLKLPDLDLVFSMMSLVIPRKLFEALIVVQLLKVNRGGIRRMIRQGARQQPMIHGQEMRNLRGVTTEPGAMMGSLKWRLTHRQGKDRHSGRRRLQWCLKMLTKQQLLIPQKELENQRKEVPTHATWIDLRSKFRERVCLTEENHSGVCFLGEKGTMVKLAATIEQEIDSVEDKDIILEVVVVALRNGSMIYITRRIGVQHRKMKRTKLLRWKHYWLHRICGWR